MRAAKILSLILVGGIVGFIIGSKNFNLLEPVKVVTSKLVKSARKKRTPASNKPRKKKQEVKKAE